MLKNKLVRNTTIIAAVIMAITASLLTISSIRTKRTLDDFNAALGTEALSIKTHQEKARDKSAASNKGVLEIKEKMFISQINDVYLNSEDYLGKTIKLEGIFKQDEGYDKTYCFVIRYGPGCCGTDGNAGFEVAWDKEAQPYPAVDSWVEATGVLKTYEEEDGYMPYLYLDLASLVVLDKRGAEFVLQ